MNDFKRTRRPHKTWSEYHPAAKAAIIAGGAVAGIGLLILCGFVVMWLWNWLVPSIFHLRLITYWEAWGLLILSAILFGRGHGGANHRSDRRRKQVLRERLHDAREGPSGDPGEAGAEESTAAFGPEPPSHAAP